MEHNKSIIFTLMFILLMSFGFSASMLQSYTYDAQYDNYGIKRNSAPFSHFEVDKNIDLSSYGYSSEFYPKVCDVDNDGKQEIISFLPNDGNMRILDYNFQTKVIDVKYIFDVTPSGYGLNDVVCLEGTTDNYNAILVTMNSSTSVKIAEYYFNPNSEDLDENIEYIHGDYPDFIPHSRLGCYEGSTHYWCYYEPDSTKFELVRLTNSVTENEFLYDPDVTAIDLYTDAQSLESISDISSNQENRIMGISIEDNFMQYDTDSFGSNSYSEKIKTIGSDYNDYDTVRYAPLVLSADRIIIQKSISSNDQRMIGINLNNHVVFNREELDGETWYGGDIGPVINSNYILNDDSPAIYYFSSGDTNYGLGIPSEYESRSFITPTTKEFSNGGLWRKHYGYSIGIAENLRKQELTIEGTAGCCNTPENYHVLPQLYDINYDPLSSINAEEYCGFDSTFLNSAFSGCIDLNSTSSIIDFEYNFASGQVAEIPFVITTYVLNNQLRPIVITYESKDSVFKYYDMKNPSLNGSLDITLEESAIITNDIEGHLLLSDLNDDGKQEILIGGVDFLYIGASSTGFTPELNIINESAYGYYNVECVSNSTKNTTFKFKECIGTSQCSYFEEGDTSIYEKVCSTCSDTESLHCGDWSLTEPSILCSNITTPGTKEIDFMFYRSTDPSVYADLTLAYVVNNDLIYTDIADDIYTESFEFDSSSCDLGQLVTPPDISEEINFTDITNGGGTGTGTTIQPTYDTPDDLINDILGEGSSLWKIIIGIGIVLGLTITVAQSYRNMPPFIIGLVAVMATILVTALGLLPAYILILIIMLSVIMIVLAKMTSGGD